MKPLALALTLAVAAGPALSATVFSGTDPAGETAQTYAAFDAWVASVGSFQKDTMDGPDSTQVITDSVVTAAGSTFNAPNGNIYGATWFVDFDTSIGTAPDFIMDGLSLGSTALWQVGNTVLSADILFTWELPEPSTAFGFFSTDHDGFELGVSFDIGDGLQAYTFQTADSNWDVNFWGISGLSAPVSVVTLSSTDTGFVFWDNFVYASPSAQVIPLPGALPLLITGLLALGAAGAARRRG